jgi:hypothetical protein
MKNALLAFGAALTLASCGSPVAVAQMSSQAGMFGNRVLGQSLAPTPSSFGGGVRTNATGSFLYLGWPNGANDFTTPWRHPYPSVLEQAVGGSPAVQLTVPSQQPTPAVQVGSPPASPAPGYNTAGFSPEQGAGVTSGVATWPAWNFALGQGGAEAASASAARAAPLARSPQLSDRLTRIARSKGMLAGRAIDVYLSGDVALVLGVVRSEADRVLLGNVVGLEPDVSRIDNRLAIAGSGGYSSSAPAENVPPRLEGYHPSTMPANGP